MQLELSGNNERVWNTFIEEEVKYQHRGSSQM